ncbi:hypothetical protein SISNIDRAFT_415228, partial [Sistotremastrum niveocremeum HHB9708]
MRRRGNRIYRRPKRRFLYQNLRRWIGRLLCQPGMEDILDRPLVNDDPPVEMKDVWDGKCFREFLGPDGLPFITGPRMPGEGRLMFGLNIDGFNPFGNKQAGKKKSTGAIYLVCFNLPPTSRYLIDNMILIGVIP